MPRNRIRRRVSAAVGPEGNLTTVATRTAESWKTIAIGTTRTVNTKSGIKGEGQNHKTYTAPGIMVSASIAHGTALRSVTLTTTMVVTV